MTFFLCNYWAYLTLLPEQEFEAKRFTNKGDKHVVKKMFNRLYGAGCKVWSRTPNPVCLID